MALCDASTKNIFFVHFKHNFYKTCYIENNAGVCANVQY